MNRDQDRPDLDAFPSVLLALCLAYYGIFFVLSAAFQHKALWPLDVPTEPYGYVGNPLDFGVFILLGAGVGALVLGYFLGVGAARLGRRHGARLRPAGLPRPPTDRHSFGEALFALCVLALAAIAAFELLAIRVPVFHQALNGALFFSVAVVRRGQIVESAPRIWRHAGYGAVLFLLAALASKQQWTALFLVVCFLALIEALHRRRGWLAWGALLMLAAAVYPAKRTPLPAEILRICLSPAEVGPTLSSRYAVTVLAQCKTNAERRDLIVAVAAWSRDQVLRRISTVRLLDRALSETPARVPFFAGETLRPLLYVAVPRILWPDKPREDIGNRIGHAYRVLLPDDRATSINLPWIVEFYINFGVKGVVLGLGLAGFALGGLAWLGTVGARSAVSPLLTVGILFPLAYQDSNISLMVGNALHGVVGTGGLIALAWFAGRYLDKSAARPHPP